MSKLYQESYPEICDPPVTKEEEVKRRENTWSVDSIEPQMRYLLGDVLTIIDASIQDHTQRKAMKDLIKGKFWDRMHWIVYPPVVRGTPEDVCKNSS